ncbi:hypothetical protein PMAYCL1PPCAC_13687, partial [Pristionchus mayeri]
TMSSEKAPIHPDSPQPFRSTSPPLYISTNIEAFNPVVPQYVVTEQPPPYPGQYSVDEDAKSTASSTDDFTWRDICCCWIIIQGTKAAGKL